MSNTIYKIKFDDRAEFNEATSRLSSHYFDIGWSDKVLLYDDVGKFTEAIGDIRQHLGFKISTTTTYNRDTDWE